MSANVGRMPGTMVFFGDRPVGWLEGHIPQPVVSQYTLPLPWDDRAPMVTCRADVTLEVRGMDRPADNSRWFQRPGPCTLLVFVLSSAEDHDLLRRRWDYWTLVDTLQQAQPAPEDAQTALPEGIATRVLPLGWMFDGSVLVGPHKQYGPKSNEAVLARWAQAKHNLLAASKAARVAAGAEMTQDMVESLRRAVYTFVHVWSPRYPGEPFGWLCRSCRGGAVAPASANHNHHDPGCWVAPLQLLVNKIRPNEMNADGSDRYPEKR